MPETITSEPEILTPDLESIQVSPSEQKVANVGSLKENIRLLTKEYLEDIKKAGGDPKIQIENFLDQFGQQGGNFQELLSSLSSPPEDGITPDELVLKEVKKKTLSQEIDLLLSSAPANSPEESSIQDKLDEYSIGLEEPISSLFPQIRPENTERAKKMLQAVVIKRQQEASNLQNQIDKATNDTEKEEVKDEKKVIDTENIEAKKNEKGELVISEIDKTTGQRIKEYIVRTAAEALPYLVAFDHAAAFLTGRRPELMAIVREINEFTGEKTSLEKIMIQLKADQSAINLIREQRITDTFFEHFVNKQDNLIRFFDQIPVSSGQMYIFLEKMSPIDIRVLVEQKRFPKNIQIEPEQLSMILSKLKPYERVKLGIHETEEKMR